MCYNAAHWVEGVDARVNGPLDTVSALVEENTMRKTYVPPTIESEEMLEQTSLACNVTALPDSSIGCAADFRKTESYFDDESMSCNTPLLYGECMVALS
jgi:hypothetical protein